MSSTITYMTLLSDVDVITYLLSIVINDNKIKCKKLNMNYLEE